MLSLALPSPSLLPSKRRWPPRLVSSPSTAFQEPSTLPASGIPSALQTRPLQTPSSATAKLKSPTDVFPCSQWLDSSPGRRSKAITHLDQVPGLLWAGLAIAIGGIETRRAEIGWVNPSDAPVGQPGLLRDDYTPGNIGFDTLGLKPTDPAEFEIMATKELQNRRLAMLAAAGCMAQELTDGKGILEHRQSS